MLEIAQRVVSNTTPIIALKERGLVPELRPLIQELRRNKIRLSEDVVQRALRLAGEA